MAPREDDLAEPDDPSQRALLDRYVAAFENADIAVLTRLLAEDAVWEMPPRVEWFTGRDTIGRLVAARCPAGPGDNRMVPTGANGQPAFALYRRGEDGVHRAHSLQVLTVSRDRITRAVAFHQRELFVAFGLPLALPAKAVAASHRTGRTSRHVAQGVARAPSCR